MKKILAISIISTALSFCFIDKSFGQSNYDKAFAAADSVNFSPSKSAGWNLFNSYVAVANDNVTLELIMAKNSPVQMAEYQELGKIKNGSAFPKSETIVPYPFPGGTLFVRIDKNGICAVKIQQGFLPTASDPRWTVIALRVNYTRL